MFISVLELFKIGIGPSSSHTMGPMVAANRFRDLCRDYLQSNPPSPGYALRCTLRGSLAFTGKGHGTDRAVLLGLYGHVPESVGLLDIDALVEQLWQRNTLRLDRAEIIFQAGIDIHFDYGVPLAEHPNGMIFELLNTDGKTLLSETYFSIGGGFVNSREEMANLIAPLQMEPLENCPYPFDSAAAMLSMAEQSGLSIAAMKRVNEQQRGVADLDDGLEAIWSAMRRCVELGLQAEGVLPGGLKVQRRARKLQQQLLAKPESSNLNDWLCAYAMAVNEENAAGHRVVTAPTNGAAGVVPAVLYYFVEHENGSREQVHDFLLTAAAVGGLIKHRSSISGAEVGCQGEVGSAAAMAAAGLCAAKGGSPEQVENAAEIALEHHLGMTCDPVNGLVQVPCIERNGFGAIKAHTAASLALRGDGRHFMPLDSCIAAMRQTGIDMSHKYKETSLGGLAVSVTEC